MSRSSYNSVLARAGPLSAPASAPPLGQSTLRKLDMVLLCPLPFLGHDHKREEHLAEPSLLGKEEAIDHTLAVDFDLPDVASQVIDIRMSSTGGANLFHRHGDHGCVIIGQLVQLSPHGL